MSLARKDLELRMTVTTNASNATAAMQQLAREAERAGMAVKSLGTGGGAGAGGGGAGGMMSSARGAIGTAGGLIVGGAAVVATIGGLHKAFLDLDNGMMTAREKTIGFAKAIPILGDALAGFMGTLMDARDRMMNPDQYKDVQRMREMNPIIAAQREARHDADQQRGALFREGQGARNNSASIRAFPTLSSGEALLRSSVGGMAGSFLKAGTDSIDPRLKAALQGLQSAERGGYASGLGVGDAESQADASRSAHAQARSLFNSARSNRDRQYEAAQAGVGKDGGQEAFDRFGFNSNPDANYAQRFGNELGAVTIGSVARQFGKLNGPASSDGTNLAMQKANFEYEDAAHRLKLADADLEEKIKRSKEANLANDRQAYQIAQAKTGIMRAQLGIMEEQLAKSKSGREQFGGMDSTSQDALLQAAQRAKAGGRENVTAAEWAMLQSNPLTQDLAKKAADADAEANPQYKKLLQITGNRDVADQQAAVDKLGANIDIKVQLDDEKFAALAEKTLGRFEGELIKVIEMAFDRRMGDIKGGQARAHAGN